MAQPVPPLSTSETYPLNNGPASRLLILLLQQWTCYNYYFNKIFYSLLFGRKKRKIEARSLAHSYTPNAHMIHPMQQPVPSGSLQRCAYAPAPHAPRCTGRSRPGKRCNAATGSDGSLREAEQTESFFAAGQEGPNRQRLFGRIAPIYDQVGGAQSSLAQLCSFCTRDACSPADERPAEPGPAPGVEAHGCELERRGAWQPRAGRVLRQRRPHLPSSGSCGPLGAGRARCGCSASRARPRAGAGRSVKAASATVVCLAAQVVGLDFAAEMLDDAAQREAAARQRRRKSAGIRWVQVGC